MRPIPSIVGLLVLFCSISVPGQARGQEDGSAGLEALLREALFEEEATRDLAKAASAYDRLLDEYERQRQFAATAMFRLAEVRRKQERAADAVELYQRLLADFPDQDPLARLSRENLTALGAAEGSAGARSAAGGDPQTAEIERLKRLIAESPDLLDQADPESRLTPLAQAARDGQIEVVEFLIDAGAALENGAHSPLVLAAGSGHLAVCDLLLDRGAEVDVHYGSPVRKALIGGHQAVFERLVERGAQLKPEWWDDSVWLSVFASPDLLNLVLRNKVDLSIPGSDGKPPLYVAVAYGDLSAVDALLKAGGVDPNLGHASEPPIVGACRAGRWPIVSALLEAGADPNVADAKGWTPLHYAANRGDVDACRALLEAGANLDAQTPDGMSPLMVAAKAAGRDVSRLLIDAGADVMRKDDKGRTAFALAGEACRDSEDPELLLLLGRAMMKAGGAREESENPGRGIFSEPGDLNAFGPVASHLRPVLMREFSYPAWYVSPHIHLVIPEAAACWVESAESGEEAEGVALHELLSSWTIGSLRIPSGRPPAWSRPVLRRRQTDGRVEVIPLDLWSDHPLPRAFPGDVIEFTSPDWERPLQGGGWNVVQGSLPRELAAYLEGLETRSVEVLLADRDPLHLSLRGGLRFYNPLLPEAPLLPAGQLLSLLADSLVLDGATIHLQREREQQRGEIEFPAGSPESGRLVLEDGDRLSVHPPETAPEIRDRVFLRSPGLAFGYELTAPDPPTLLQFLAHFYAAAPGLPEAARADDLGLKELAGIEVSRLLPHPDWSRVRIRRPDLLEADPMAVQEIDLEAAMAAVKAEPTRTEARKHDVQLRGGDIIELPVREDQGGEPWLGLGESAERLFEMALARDVVCENEEGELRFVTTRYVPTRFVETRAGSIPFPASPLTDGAVNSFRAIDLVRSIGMEYGAMVFRDDHQLQVSGELWLRDGDRLVPNPIPSVPIPRRRVILPPSSGG